MFSGKGAREEAARALADAVMSRHDHTLLQRGVFKGFEILSRDQPGVAVPDLFIRRTGTYAAHINADNPIGTMQSIERALRSLDRLGDEEALELQHLEKTFIDYQAQTGRPFEHDTRLKELLAQQARLNAALDLDNNDALGGGNRGRP